MKKILLVFGGKSAEHEVSITSAASIFRNIDRNKYIIGCLGISKSGEFIPNANPAAFDRMKGEMSRHAQTLPLSDEYFRADNYLELIEKADIIFPLVHGPGGEDGSLQGFFETLNKPYVGCGITASALCMDKIFTKIVLENSGIKTTPFMTLNRLDHLRNRNFRTEVEKLGFPMFIKPANMGSSIGITKVNTIEELVPALEIALHYDHRILIETAIVGRELEISVMGNDDLEVSIAGEIRMQSGYYDYESKYLTDSAELIVPAELTEDELKKIRDTAAKAYKVLDCRGFARVDFFLADDGELYLNEINTIPGFTNISMFPRLFMHCGYTYSELIDNLIELAEEQSTEVEI